MHFFLCLTKTFTLLKIKQCFVGHKALVLTFQLGVLEYSSTVGWWTFVRDDTATKQWHFCAAFIEAATGELRPRVMVFQSNKLRSWDIFWIMNKVSENKKKIDFFCLLISEKFDASGSFGHTHTHTHTHPPTSKLKIGRHYWLFFLLPVLFVWCNLTFFFRNDGWSKPDFSLIMPPYRYS